jgi:putative DNA primase/helicase
MSAVVDENQRIEAALSCIPADLPRDEWARIGAALKHELGEAGFDLFDSWSQRGDSYDAAAARSTWRSLSASGGITINTLFHVAIEHGFDARGTGAATVDPDELVRRRAEREDRVARDARERETRALAAAGLAETVWRTATAVSAGNSYLVRKGVQPVDTLREIDAGKLAALIGYQPKRGDDLLTGRILIAPVKVGGKLSTLEMIDGRGRKSALAGGVKVGGYWAAQAMPDAPEVLLIAEGVATALSASQCTGYPAIAALSVGQMEAAARAVHELCPSAVLVMLADLDKTTGEPHETAVKAAQSVGTKLAAPDFGVTCEPGQTDFNDMHAVRGAEALKAVIDVAIAAPTYPVNSEGQPASDDAPASTAKEAHYAVINGGLCFVNTKLDRETGEVTYTAPMWLCDPLEVLGSGRDDAGRQYRLLQWRRQGSGETIRLAMPSADIGEREGWAAMRNQGLAVATQPAARHRLAYYLQKEGGADWYEIVMLTGWQHGAYLLPSGDLIGTPSRKMFYSGGTPKQSAYAPAGSLQTWRDTVGAMARENPLIAAAIACALAGPLLSLIGARDGIGLHLHARTSSGKSTAGDCAASVWGNPSDVLHTWDGTSYGLARTAEYANDGLLYLDEIGAGDARKIGPAIYQMLNGVSRLQGTKDGGVVASRSWRLTMISTGEVGMAQYLAEGGQTPRGGQEIRLLDVPADSGTYRAFDCLHGRKNGDAFSVELTAAARANYGTVGRAFVEWLATHRSEVKAWVTATQDDMLEAIETEHPNVAPAARRATRKWAILVSAAEMASDAGLTGWTRDEARTWVMSAWARWLDAFGTADRDNERLLEQVDGILRANEHGRFVLLPVDPANEPNVHNILGYRRYVNDEPVFLVLPSAFRDELIKGYELRHACRVLHEAGMLDRSDKRERYTVNAGKPAGMVYRARTRKDEDAEGRHAA